MEASKSESRCKVYHRKKKASAVSHVTQEQAIQDPISVLQTPAKPKANKVYIKRKSKKALSVMFASPTFKSSSFPSETKGSCDSSTVISREETKDQDSNGTLCANLDSSSCTDSRGSIFKPLDIFGSAFEPTNDNGKYTNGWTNEVADCVVSLVCEESNQFLHDSPSSCSGSPGCIELSKSVFGLLDTKHNRDAREDAPACTDLEDGCIVCLSSQESNNVCHDGLVAASRELLSEKAGCVVSLDSEDLDKVLHDSSGCCLDSVRCIDLSKNVFEGLDTGNNRGFWEDTNTCTDVEVGCVVALGSQESNDILDGGVAVESTEFLKVASPISLTDNLDPASNFQVNNSTQENNKTFFFPGDHGFLLVPESPESEATQNTKSPNSSANPNDHLSPEKNLKSANEQKTGKSSLKAPRRKVKKKMHRPRIMVAGKQKRKPKVSMPKPLNLGKQHLSKKRKIENTEPEILIGPETPGKQNVTKRQKNEKTKDLAVDPATPSPSENGNKKTGPEKSVSVDVVRSLKFDLENRTKEETSLVEVIHPNGHKDGVADKSKSIGRAIDSDTQLGGHLVRDLNQGCEQVIGAKKSGDQNNHIAENRRLLRRSKCLSISRKLGPNCPEEFRRKRTSRRWRSNLSGLKFQIPLSIPEVFPSGFKRKKKSLKVITQFVFARKKRSKRFIPLRNISKLLEIPVCHQLPTRFQVLRGSDRVNQNQAEKSPKIPSDVGSDILNSEDEAILGYTQLAYHNDIFSTDRHVSDTQTTPSLGNVEIQIGNSEGKNFSSVGECERVEIIPKPESLIDALFTETAERWTGMMPFPFFPFTSGCYIMDGSNENRIGHESYAMLDQQVLESHESPQLEVATRRSIASGGVLFQDLLPPWFNIFPSEVPLQYQDRQPLYANNLPMRQLVGLDHIQRIEEASHLEPNLSLDRQLVVLDHVQETEASGVEPNLGSDRQLVLDHIAEVNKSLLPYKKKPRKIPKSAKVALDPETIKRWELLMMNGAKGEERVDEASEKKWEEERGILRSRLDLFIKRMHLLQADRKFKPWKGSVVDSVVGVFLTQNVSDNLSSKAYMTLAATFPPKSTCNYRENHEKLQLPVDNYVGHPEPLLNLEGLIYFVDEPPEEDKSQTETNELVVEGKALTPAEVESGEIVIPTLSRETSSHENTIISCDRGRKIGFKTSEAMECENQRLSFDKVNDDLKGTVASISLFESENASNTTQEKDKPILVGSQKGRARKVKDKKPTLRRNKKTGVMEAEEVDWKSLRKTFTKGGPRDRDQMDMVDWEAVRVAELEKVANSIRDRGQHTIIAGRIQDFLNYEVQRNQTIDLEWLRHAPPHSVKQYLLGVHGLGLKSVECIRLLGLQHVAFPVDTNVGRIVVRLGWVPLEPLPEETQMHTLKQYPLMDSIQKYLWPRLCNLDKETLYELHYQLITFGKVFCTKKKPNCNACPMKAECRHFASAFASARLALPGSRGNTKGSSEAPVVPANLAIDANKTSTITEIEEHSSPESGHQTNSCEPTIEMPPSPIPESPESLYIEESPCRPVPELLDIEEAPCKPVPQLLNIEEAPCKTGCYSDVEIPFIDMDMETFKTNVRDAMQRIKRILHRDDDISEALVALTPETTSIPMEKVKFQDRLRTEHVVYILPDDHMLLRGFEKREPDDPSPYLLSTWQPGETPMSFTPPRKRCNSEGSELCNNKTCASCCRIREETSNTTRGTILIPCRTAMRGYFPLNGTYFQINEVFADHETSFKPIIFSRDLLYGLKARALYCGSSIPAIFKRLETRQIQLCFWTGYICLRGFHRGTSAPKELARRLHIPRNKISKNVDGE